MCVVFVVVVFRNYNLSLPRREVEEVDSLRDEWVKLIELAEKVKGWSSNVNVHDMLVCVFFFNFYFQVYLILSILKVGRCHFFPPFYMYSVHGIVQFTF